MTQPPQPSQPKPQPTPQPRPNPTPQPNTQVPGRIREHVEPPRPWPKP